MSRFKGTGRGTASGAPLEAVVQDLCDTRTDLKRNTAAVHAMKEMAAGSKVVMEGMAVTMNSMRDLMRELRELTREGIAESKLFWAKMDDMQTQLEESRDALDKNTGARDG